MKERSGAVSSKSVSHHDRMQPFLWVSIIFILWNVGSFVATDITEHPRWMLLEHERCGNSNADRIIGGKNASLGAYPWIARIGYNEAPTNHSSEKNELTYKCGGSLINKLYIVTAAHCVADLPVKLKVAGIRLGEHNTATDPDCENNFCGEPVQDFEPEQIDGKSTSTPSSNTATWNLSSNPLLPSSCGQDLTQRLVGGEKADIYEFPWMALLEYTKPTGRTHACGGVLISKRYVMTAAHCIKGKDLPPSWKLEGVRLGEYDTSTDIDCIQASETQKLCIDPVVTVGIEQKIVHEDYRPQSRDQTNDIALLRLSRDVTFTNYIRPICLPSSASMTERFFYIAGWGKTETRSESNIKLKLKIPLADTTSCANTYQAASIRIGDTQVCAGGQRGRDSCRGDSGGPLMSVKTSGDNVYWTAVGIVSLGPSPCGMENWPGIYTRVDSFVPWILSKIRAFSSRCLIKIDSAFQSLTRMVGSSCFIAVPSGRYTIGRMYVVGQPSTFYNNDKTPPPAAASRIFYESGYRLLLDICSEAVNIYTNGSKTKLQPAAGLEYDCIKIRILHAVSSSTFRYLFYKENHSTESTRVLDTQSYHTHYQIKTSRLVGCLASIGIYRVFFLRHIGQLRMMLFYLGLIFLAISGSNGREYERFFPSEEPCQTVSGTTGDCVNINHCDQLRELLNQRRPLPSSTLSILNKSQCGFEGNLPKVCCPRNTQPEPTTTTNVPDVPDVSNEIPPPPDVTNHPNLRLLDNVRCGPITEPKIFGGNKTTVFEFPWMALIGYDVGKRDPEFRCGGSVISKRYILTAAHCVTGLSPRLRLVGVRIGEHDLSTERDCDMEEGVAIACADKYQDFLVERSYPHPGYVGKQVQAHDIALIRINGDANFQPASVRPICLPIGEAARVQRPKVIVTGWGATESGTRSENLLKVKLPVVPHSTCAKFYKNYTIDISYRQLCAGGSNGMDSCSGDSGGPMQFPGSYINGQPRYIQYGIVSFGPKRCGIEGFPGVYTSVPYYMDWILDTMTD
ncbi:uncharacterized protein LOC124414191 [Diprion similis]|uniref:uncharacterized protein LOC124414191 n=1 Tax=Diprion similis TaxID=362088 RepID=UPI001EF82503|nr:uncharacterized protein LOC124414191 [Diprion similis]